MAGRALCAQEYSFRSFGVTEGLTNLSIRRIYQDRVGFIWVSTENGIFRCDGDRFEAFGASQGMPSNSGSAFGEAPDGSLLVGGDFGLGICTGYCRDIASRMGTKALSGAAVSFCVKRISSNEATAGADRSLCSAPHI